MIRPVRYAGWSGNSAQASANITKGPITQFNTSEATSNRVSPVTSPSLR